MRTLSIAALVLALAAPAYAAPFGKPRTLGTTQSAWEYDSMFSAQGPGGGVAFFVAGEKQVGLKTTQRLFIARVEGSGRTHRLTTTRIKGFAPARSYDGGPPFAYLAVGPRWRMLTTERRATRIYNISAYYAVRLAPNGRRVAAQRLGPSTKASGQIRTNARGDAIATFDDGFVIARAAGRFVRAPKALRLHDSLPRLVDDGSLYDFRRTSDAALAVVHSRGGHWGRAQSLLPALSGMGVLYRDVVTSAGGHALVVYGNAASVFDSNLTARWARRRGSFGPPVELTPHADPLSVALQAVPGGAFAVQWRDTDPDLRGPRGLHLMRASRPGRRFREVASWTAPEFADFHTLLPLRDGRTLLAWATHDPDFDGPDRLMAAVFDARGKLGPTQRIAVRRGLDCFELRRVGARRAALVWTETHKRKKRWRIAFTRR